MNKTGSVEKKEYPLPVLGLLFHTAALLLFFVIELISVAIRDTMQNLTGLAVFLLPVLYAAAIIIWTVKKQSPIRAGRSLLTLLAFFGTGALLLFFFGYVTQISRRPPLEPGTLPGLPDIFFDVFLFGWLYLLFDSALLLLSFLIRGILRSIRSSGSAGR